MYIHTYIYTYIRIYIYIYTEGHKIGIPYIMFREISGI